MAQRPDAFELLAIARQTLLERLLPALPVDQKFDGLMIANALAIAGREIRDQAAGQRRMATRLAALYDEVMPPDAAEIAPMMARLEARLARDIRAGSFDGDAALRRKVFEHLWATARDRVAISNPKALADEPAEDRS
jgi:urease accessory protein UreF